VRVVITLIVLFWTLLLGFGLYSSKWATFHQPPKDIDLLFVVQNLFVSEKKVIILIIFVCFFDLMIDLGPLRLFVSDFGRKKSVSWESHKTTGALPSLVSFSLTEGGGTLFLCGGKPFKTNEMATWVLDVTFLLASAATASATLVTASSSLVSSSGSSPNSPTVGRNNRYGTIRSMFRRKSVTEPKFAVDNIAPLATTAAGVQSEDSQAEASLSTSSTDNAVVSSLNFSSLPTPSGGGTGTKSRLSKKGVDEIANANSSSKSPATLRRKESSGRFDDKLSRDSFSTRSPATSPGRTQKEIEQDDLLHVTLADTTHKMDKLRMELDLERKKSSALREEIEKISGKSDASLLVRKALEEEVKRSAAFAVKVESLEKETTSSQQQLIMVQGQNARLK
jgi:hypothetical protein